MFTQLIDDVTYRILKYNKMNSLLASLFEFIHLRDIQVFPVE